MRIRLFLLVVLILPVLSVSAQVNKKLTKARSKECKLTVPPNGVWLYNNTFIDETEIANIHWLEFEYYAKQDSSEAYYQSLEPYYEDIKWAPYDTSAYLYDRDSIQRYPEEGDPYMDHYLRYPGFRYYPVVGITYDQALQYCQWRSDIVNASYNQKLKDKGSSKRVYFHFRLPTEEEWELAAYGFDSTRKTETGLLQNEMPYSEYLKKDLASKTIIVATKDQSLPNFNCYYEFPATYKDHTLINTGLCPTNLIYDRLPNAMGLYNMVGNVAEMISTEGVTKGGSWRQPADSCYISQRQNYDCPNEWVGFRCVCDVYEYSVDSAAPALLRYVPKASECSFVKERSYVDEFERNKKDAEYIKELTIAYGEKYDNNRRGRLMINGIETQIQKVITLDSSTIENTKWCVEDMPLIDSSEVIFCKVIGYKILLPYYQYKSLATSTEMLQPYLNTYEQVEYIYGLFIQVYYQENGETKSESYYRVLEYKPGITIDHGQ